MRSIKFRGQKKWNGHWLYCDLNNEILSDEPSDFFQYDLIPKTVGQFTGLHDKNRKEIYEGDILSYNNGLGRRKTIQIFWKKGGLCFNTHNDDLYKNPNDIIFYDACADMQDSQWLEQCEIIGNIHDNPILITN